MQHNDREEPNQELSPWLRERLADRARPFTAQPITPASIPATGPDTRQQISLIGENSRRLSRWVIDHSQLASVVARATHLSLLPGAFGTIWRKPAFVPAVWQRVIDLPWFGQGRECLRGFAETVGYAADGQQTGTISMQNRLYPSTPVTSEEATDTYSLSNSDFPPQPFTGSEPPNITRDHPHTTHTGTLPVFNKDAVDTPRLGEPTQRPSITSRVPSFYPVDEAYPAIIQNLFSQSIGKDRLSAANYEVPHDARSASIPLIANINTADTEAQGTDTFTSPLSQSLVSMPGLDKADTPIITEHQYTEAAPERPTKTYQSTFHTHPDQSPPQLSTPAPQRMIPRSENIEAHPGTTAGNIVGGRASPARDSSYSKSTTRAGEPGRPIARQAALPLITNMPGGILNRASQPSVPEAANRFDEPVYTSPYQKLAPGETPGVFPHSIAPQQEAGVSQTRTAVPFISRKAIQARPEAQVTHQSEGMPYPVTEARGNMEQDFEGHAEKPLSYQAVPSIAGTAIRPLSIVRSISRPVALPYPQLFKSTANLHPHDDKSENYNLPRNREYAPISLDHMDTHQPALELPIAYPSRPKADSSITRSEELFRYTSDNVPGFTHSGNSGTSQVPFIPIARAPEPSETSQASATESAREEGDGKEPSLDLKALAREIYPLIKRIIMVERERRSA